MTLPVKSTVAAKKNVSKVSNPGYSLYNRVEPVQGGKHFFERLLQLIGEAQHTIHFQTYAFEEDATGQLVADALIAAAQRKVEVYVLVDGFASQQLSDDFIQQLKNSGVRFRLFEPFLKSKNFYFGRRLHHKVVVADSARALVGSMNIADRYNDTGGKKSWLDVAVYVEGEVASQLQKVCWRLWIKKRRAGIATNKAAHDFAMAIPQKEQAAVRVRQNDWVMQKIEITRSYYALLTHAKDSVYIMCSYFLPGKKILRHLKQASQRGVKIYVVLAGNSDVITAKLAERYLYRWLFRHKIAVYEYQPTVLHAKITIADGEVYTIGSYNLNGLSAHASIELNLDIRDKKSGTIIEKQIKKIIKEDCQAVETDTYVTHLFRPRQLLHWLSYQLMNIILTLTTFYFRQKE